jgi:hypothetical protein
MSKIMDLLLTTILVIIVLATIAYTCIAVSFGGVKPCFMAIFLWSIGIPLVAMFATR